MSKLVFDQDSQKGFEATPIDPFIPNIEKMLVTAMRNEVNIASSTFYIDGEETEKLSATIVVEDVFYYNCAITRHGMDLNTLSECYQVNFEHRNGNIFDTVHGQPDNFMTYLRSYEIDTVYLIGNNYSGNILDTVRGLLKNQYKVAVVEDAINNLTDYVEETLLDYAQQSGKLRFITTEEAIGELSE